MLQTDLKDAVKNIYTIQNSVCAKDRPDRGIYNFVHARVRLIVCKEHIQENWVIDLMTSNYLVNTERPICAKGRPDRGCREHISTKIRYLT